MTNEGDGGPRGVRVATLDEIEESQLVEIGDRKYLLYHDGEDYRAYRNVCPHQYGPVAEGRVEDGTVFCPWHGWGFDLETGREIHSGFDRQLAHVAVSVEDGAVYLDVPDPG